MQCHDSGFRGRTGIYEVMEIDEQLRSLVHNRSGEQEMKKYLRTIKHENLREEGLRVVEEGKSTLEEVLRVTHIETREAIRAEKHRGDDRSKQPAEPAPLLV